ncbi:MAG: ABC transporter ATP-binding protein [Anaerolineales bacterium]
MATINPTYEHDLKHVTSGDRFVGLWRLLIGFRLAYTGATGGQAMAALAKTGTFLLLKFVVDDVLGGRQPMSLLPWIAGGFVALAVIEGGFTFLSGRLAAHTSEGIARRLRDYLFDHIQRLSFSYHDRAQTGELIQRTTSDVDALRRFFAEQAIAVGRIVLLFTINLAALMSLSVTLAVVSIVTVPLILAISLFFFKRISVAYEANQNQDARMSTTLQENLTAVRVVKAFARQAYERDKFEAENAEKLRRGLRLLMWHSIFWPVTDVIIGLQLVGGFAFGALLAIRGDITVGTYLAFAGMIIWIVFPLRVLGRLVVEMSRGMVSFSRVAELIEENREPLLAGSVRPSGNLRGAVAFDDVSFEYGGDHAPVLHNITFQCEAGQTVGLLGPTGAGKTSLVNLLPRFYDYTAGSIKLDGVELCEYPRKFLRQQTGIVEQEPFLFSRTIRENITYGVGRAVTDAEVEQAARAAAVHDVIRAFPRGYSTLVGERGVTLSGGQKQRIAIARTLLKDPRILILDDSTSSVDTETETEIRAALERLMEGRTTFIIAHRIHSVMDADLILVLQDGRIVQRGTHADLMAQAGLYRQTYELQALIEEELEREAALA